MSTTNHATPSSGFDVILGNPPFLNQLETSTANSQRVALLLRTTSQGSSKGYADLSATFLRHAMTITRPRGRVSMVQPQAFLATTSGKAIRDSLLTYGSIAHIWVSNEHVFDNAQVYTCALTFIRNNFGPIEIQRTTGSSFEPLSPTLRSCDQLMLLATWSPLAAAASGVPELPVNTLPHIGTIADATADFRDQYYGLDGFIVEDADLSDEERKQPLAYPPLMTTGLLDLGHSLWGTQTTRILKTKWDAPRVDRKAMQERGELSGWISERLRPKVLMATQTKVLEVFVDAKGSYLPSIPLITITPHRQDDLWLIAAALASPVATAVAMERHSGAAMSADAIKLSAKQVLRLPLPVDRRLWEAAADSLRTIHESATAPARSDLQEFGEIAARSYNLDSFIESELLKWWLGRVPSAP